MDLNLTVIAGRLAAEPVLKTFESGSRLLRCLVTVRTENPRRRIDVLPVVLWDPSDELVADAVAQNVRGLPVWIAGSVQRRFWSEGTPNTSRIEIVAHEIQIRHDKEVSNA